MHCVLCAHYTFVIDDSTRCAPQLYLSRALDFGELVYSGMQPSEGQQSIFPHNRIILDTCAFAFSLLRPSSPPPTRSLCTLAETCSQRPEETRRHMHVLYLYLYLSRDAMPGTYPLGLIATVNLGTLAVTYSPLAYLSELSGDYKFVIQVQYTNR